MENCKSCKYWYARGTIGDCEKLPDYWGMKFETEETGQYDKYGEELEFPVIAISTVEDFCCILYEAME